MIKFIHKKHYKKDRQEPKLMIYYSVTEIVLGFLLVALVGFFAVTYIHDHTYGRVSSTCFGVYKPQY